MDLQPELDAMLASVTREDLVATGRGVALVLALLVGFMLLLQSGRSVAARAERALHERIVRDEQHAYVASTLTHLPSAITFALVYAV